MVKKKKVLIIDDEKDFLTVVKLNLDETGKFEVLTSSSAKDIISLVRTFKPDIILLDTLMPVINGMKACDMLNDDAVARDIPVMIVSGLEKLEDKLKAHKRGVAGYVIKPIGKDELIAKIKKVLFSK